MTTLLPIYSHRSRVAYVVRRYDKVYTMMLLYPDNSTAMVVSGNRRRIEQVYNDIKKRINTGQL